MMQDLDDDADAFEYLGGVVDVKIDAPAALNSESFMRLQTEEHFESMAQVKNHRQHSEPLSRTVLVKFGFLKDGTGFHLGSDKFRFKEENIEYPDAILLAVQGDTPVNLPNKQKFQLSTSSFSVCWNLINNLLVGDIQSFAASLAD